MTAASCPRCGRPTWQRHGGMGGGIVPDAETHCLQMGGMWCRTAAAGYRAGIDEGLELAKAYVLAHVESRIHPRVVIDWTDVDEAAEAAKGEP